jgi:hypothetical protein
MTLSNAMRKDHDSSFCPTTCFVREGLDMGSDGSCLV